MIDTEKIEPVFSEIIQIQPKATKFVEAPISDESQALQSTPEFQAWKESKIKEALVYARTAWKMEIPREKLILRAVDDGFPDFDRQQMGHKILLSNLFYTQATGERTNHFIWRSLD
ncbi:hypothetical protein [Microcoleus sp. bin38.metabat.b11b12b14.051]|uniref:hypothetical protein n=1 Tax=Microcoleus sp. bin38.metabat.b11b12b14.051 TaxID=2742709 RepID=UPI0025DA090C|nr:hypothetical protein [Microcoleus sp. bin38.metabat.b11b12b14.051]